MDNDPSKSSLASSDPAITNGNGESRAKDSGPFSSPAWHVRSSVVLYASLVVILAYVGMILGVGFARGWNVDPNTGVLSFPVVRDPARFWPKPNQTDPSASYMASFPGRSNRNAYTLWYYWRLPPPNTSALTVALPWVGYLAHQLVIWGLTFRAMAMRPKYTTTLRSFNWELLLANLFFHLLHFGQTHWTYDAIAPQVSISSSQGSVILVLSMILIVEYQTRAGVWQWPASHDSRFRLGPAPVALIRKYHGVYFAWASIYTFWYHPCESTLAHFAGFILTSLVLLQGSLVYTSVHRNKFWRAFVEAYVVIHAVTVAWVNQQGPVWTMFLFGFLLVTVLSTLPGLMPRDANRAMLVAPFLAWLVAVIAVYAANRNFNMVYNVVFIPLYLYGFFLVLWGTTWVVLKLRPAALKDSPPPAAVSGLAFLACYAAAVGVSAGVQSALVDMDLLALAAVLVAIYSVLAPISMVCWEDALNRVAPVSPASDPSRASGDGSLPRDGDDNNLAKA